jgi:putative phage-type endonuclease
MLSRREWLLERKKGIGGSDAPAILGVNPYQTAYQLWIEKTTAAVDDDEPTPAMLRGQYLEGIAAQVYEEKTGRTLEEAPDSLAHPEHSFMRANIDRKIVGDPRGPGVLEIKCPGLHIFGKCKREGLAEMYVVQAQHYLAVTGTTWCSFAIFSAELWDLVWFDIDRDETLIEVLVREEGAFWDHVERDVPPIMPDEPVVKLPPVDGELVKMSSAAWTQAVKDYKTALEIEAEAKAVKTAAQQKLQALMGEAQVAEGSGFRAYWKPQKGRKTLDKAAFKKAHPGIDLNDFMKAGKPSRPFRTYFLKQ